MSCYSGVANSWENHNDNNLRVVPLELGINITNRLANAATHRVAKLAHLGFSLHSKKRTSSKAKGGHH